MADIRDLLERERERFTLPPDAFERLVRRRARRQRRGRITTLVVALVVAAGGVGGGLWAVRDAGRGRSRIGTPSGTPPTPPTSPTSSSSSAPIRAEGPPAIAGPVQFLDDRNGWMVGSNGDVLSTTDGGHTWAEVLGSAPAAVAVDFVDLRHGWVLTAEGVLRTTDGGASWQDLGDPALVTAQFLTADVGWGVQLRPATPGLGLLVQTDDGGATWTEQGGLDLNSVCFTDPTHGWAAGPAEAGLALFKTDDGGATWDEHALPTPGGDMAAGWSGTVRCAGMDAWVLGSDGVAGGHQAFAVWRGGTGGPNADPVLQEASTHPLGEGLGIPTAGGPYPGPMVAFDGGRAYVASVCPSCDGGSQFAWLDRTADGGATWASSPVDAGLGSPAGIVGASFVSPDVGWIVIEASDGSYTVLRTNEGGQTWSQP